MTHGIHSTPRVPSAMTDAEFLLHVLSDGCEHSLGEILAWSIAERGYGLTVHSRASDLRRQGHEIVQRSTRGRNGRVVSWYRLERAAA